MGKEQGYQPIDGASEGHERAPRVEVLDQEFRRVFLLCDLEEPIWDKSLTTPVDFREHLWACLYKCSLDDPENLPFLQEICDRFVQHMDDIASYRDQVVPEEERTDNPLKDISDSKEAKRAFLRDFGVDFSILSPNDPTYVPHFSIDEKYPFCFILRYTGKGALLEALGRKGKPHPLLRGLHFHEQGSNPLLFNKVNILFTDNGEYGGWSDRVYSLEHRAKPHELRHQLDFIYRNNPNSANWSEYLELTILVELPVEGSPENIIQNVPDKLFSYASPKDPVLLKEQWFQRVKDIIALEREVHKRDLELDGRKINKVRFLTLLTSLSTSVDQLEVRLKSLLNRE